MMPQIFKIVRKVKIAPLSVIGSPSLRTELSNKCPNAQLLAFFAGRWDAPEWIFNIMSGA